MNTRIVYCDETGDDGKNTSSSEAFILTSMSMPSESWQSNYDIIKKFRKELKKDYFIQICDFISFFVHLYYKTRYKKENLPNRVGRLIDNDFVGSVMATFSKNEVFNSKASSNKHGLVIYPK